MLSILSYFAPLLYLLANSPKHWLDLAGENSHMKTGLSVSTLQMTLLCIWEKNKYE